jgi:hypothetical protein
MMIESLIIDSDHWRHVFLLLGVQWGLIAATRASLMSRRLVSTRQTGTRRPTLHAPLRRRKGFSVGA